MEIVIIKGLGSGLGSLVIALVVGEEIGSLIYIPAVLLLGFVAYGLSIFFYVYAQREIGAAKTSAYYAVAPFIGVVLSFIILGEKPNITFGIALIIMIANVKENKDRILEVVGYIEQNLDKNLTLETLAEIA